MTNSPSPKKLISKRMLALNAELHGRNKKYGAKGHDWADRVSGYLEAEQAVSYLDYGAGKGTLAAEIAKRFTHPEAGAVLGVFAYDPVTFPDTPEPADFVTCCDVLEHIEPVLLDNVLEDIASKIKSRGLLVISQRLANKRLADGRNAHLIIEKTPWWAERLSKYFGEIIEVEPIKPKRVGIEVAFLVRPRRHSPEVTHAVVELIKR